MKVVKWGNCETGLVFGTLEATGEDRLSFYSSVWLDWIKLPEVAKKFTACFFFGYVTLLCI